MEIIIISMITLGLSISLKLGSDKTLKENKRVLARVAQERITLEKLNTVVARACGKARESLQEATYERKLAQYHSEINEKNRGESC